MQHHCCYNCDCRWYWILFQACQKQCRWSRLNSPAPSPPPILGALEKNVYERGIGDAKSGLFEHSQKKHTGFYFNVSRRLSPGRALGLYLRGQYEARRSRGALAQSSRICLRSCTAWIRAPSPTTSMIQSLARRLRRAVPGLPTAARLVPQVSLQGLDFASFFTDKEGDADGAREERSGRLLFALLQQAVTLNLDGLILDAHTYLARLDQSTRQIVAPRVHIFVQLLAQQLSVQAQESLDSAGVTGSGQELLHEGLVPRGAATSAALLSRSVQAALQQQRWRHPANDELLGGEGSGGADRTAQMDARFVGCVGGRIARGG